MMPETTEARDRIISWKEENNVSYQQIALMVGKHKQEVYDAVMGRNKSPEANKILLRIIQMFGIK